MHSFNFLKRKTIKNTNNNEINIDEKKKYDINFDYLNYERNIITEKMLKDAHWQFSEKQVYFVNGLIWKIKPKSCLGVAGNKRYC